MKYDKAVVLNKNKDKSKGMIRILAHHRARNLIQICPWLPAGRRAVCVGAAGRGGAGLQSALHEGIAHVALTASAHGTAACYYE